MVRKPTRGARRPDPARECRTVRWEILGVGPNASPVAPRGSPAGLGLSKARYTFLAARIFGWAVSNMNGKPMTVVGTSLKLRGWRQLRRFFKLNGAIKRQLNVSSGLVQYRLKADFLRLRFSTLSVWINGQAVDDFTNTGAHREAIA